MMLIDGGSISMLPDEYLKVLLGRPPVTELEQVKTTIALVTGREVSSQELETKLMELYPDINNVKKARALIYKIDECFLIRSRRQKNDGDIHPVWFYTVNMHLDALKQNAIDKELASIMQIKDRFTENSLVFYCDAFCSPLLYTYEEMMESKGKCPECKVALLTTMMEEQKKGLIEKYVYSLSDIVDKDAILTDIFSAVFPYGFDDGYTFESIPARQKTPSRASRRVKDAGKHATKITSSNPPIATTMPLMEDCHCPTHGTTVVSAITSPSFLAVIDGIIDDGFPPVTRSEALAMLRWVTAMCDHDIDMKLACRKRRRIVAASTVQPLMH